MIRADFTFSVALKRLAESLNATAVLSDDYAKEIFLMAQNAYAEGYSEGEKKC